MHQDRQVQGQLRETEVTLDSQAFLDPLEGKENQELQEALEHPVDLVFKVNRPHHTDLKQKYISVITN